MYLKSLYTTVISTVILLLGIAGCSAPVVPPVKVEVSNRVVNYVADVKPILDKRCVTCHSCYNSPCQAKFSSFEGVDRGASKLVVYDAMRLQAQDPTRLFIDAQTTTQWRDKEFYSLTDNTNQSDGFNDSIMMHMLHDKELHPDVIGSYDPEVDELACPRNKEEINEYMEDKPNHGMPYGMPKIEDAEYHTLASWLQQGAHGPSKAEQKKLTTPSQAVSKEIVKWEEFFNQSDAKHTVTARYLYEHLYLAHWNFSVAPDEFYEIVRSKTPSPEPVDLVVTLRPYDDPKVDKFYYRLVKIHSTLVHKTHMVVEFDDEKLARMNELFIEPKWTEKPHYINYETKKSANPFLAFYQIPAKSRYQFLLDNSHYIIMTFIRGPVCRGQMALNVIHDHFWLMFQDPEYDLTVQQPSFLLREADNLEMPIETSSQSVFKTFSDEYKEKFEQYFINKAKLYQETYPNGLGVETIWKGNKASDAPLLTIYRHFNSASVHKGVIGELPRTMWVLDYSEIERIYYLLVAGYDVFGNISHQTNIRRYFDYIRMEGELNFLTYMPQDKRLKIFKSWYIDDDDVQDLEDLDIDKIPTAFQYKSEYPKAEFIEELVNNQILKSTDISFDHINYYTEGQTPPAMPTEFNSKKDLKDGFRSLTAPGTGFISYVTDNHVNVIHLRVIMEDNTNIVGSIVINRWHDNVNSMFNGEQSNPKKDTMDFVKGSIGSYPNMFAIVKYDELPDFFNIMKNFNGSDEYKNRLKKYFIPRNSPKFWSTFDWFQNHFNESDPVNSALYDLNRYYYKGW
jgi:hypothetical protein